MIYRALRPLIFSFDAERAHRATIAALKALPTRMPRHDRVLQTELAGLALPSPIGLAAGFDKDAEVPDTMLSLGFGFVEIGTVTPVAQAGNAKPRLFRLVEDKAVINRMGFNNEGHDAAYMRLLARKRHGIVGVNIGANKDSADRIGDYVKGAQRFADVADYLTVNVSSPNTPDLRALQDAGALTELLDALAAVRRSDGPPLFLKLAPDLDRAEIDAAVKASGGKVAALIIGNTTVTRPALASRFRDETGGLSGSPLGSLAAAKLGEFTRATGGEIPLIAAGGIDSGAEAYARIRNGASLVQLYSALVYHGPGLAGTIARDLAALLRRDGFTRMSDAVGLDA